MEFTHAQIHNFLSRLQILTTLNWPSSSLPFAGYGVFVFVSSIVLFITGIIIAIIRSHIAHIVFSGIVALMFSFYMIYDTQASVCISVELASICMCVYGLL